MLDADIGRELVLELGDLRPEDIAAVLDDAVDRGFQPVADTLALRAKIDELHVCPESRCPILRLIAEKIFARKRRAGPG